MNTNGIKEERRQKKDARVEMGGITGEGGEGFGQFGGVGDEECAGGFVADGVLNEKKISDAMTLVFVVFRMLLKS